MNGAIGNQPPSYQSNSIPIQNNSAPRAINVRATDESTVTWDPTDTENHPYPAQIPLAALGLPYSKRQVIMQHPSRYLNGMTPGANQLVAPPFPHNNQYSMTQGAIQGMAPPLQHNNQYGMGGYWPPNQIGNPYGMGGDDWQYAQMNSPYGMGVNCSMGPMYHPYGYVPANYSSYGMGWHGPQMSPNHPQPPYQHGPQMSQSHSQPPYQAPHQSPNQQPVRPQQHVAPANGSGHARPPSTSVPSPVEQPSRVPYSTTTRQSLETGIIPTSGQALQEQLDALAGLKPNELASKSRVIASIHDPLMEIQTTQLQILQELQERLGGGPTQPHTDSMVRDAAKRDTEAGEHDGSSQPVSKKYRAVEDDPMPPTMYDEEPIPPTRYQFLQGSPPGSSRTSGHRQT